jgi:hypothetical protein
MSYFRIGDRGILYTATGAKAVDFTTGPGGTITPAVTLEFIDTSGVMQNIPVVDGVTTISGVAPFMVHIDASGTRLPSAFAAQSAIADAEAYAFHMGGYRINFGEELGTTWTFGRGASRDEELGPPIFGRVFLTTGTKNVRLKIRDALGNEQTVSFNVVVSAPAAPTIIETSAGGWPTWVTGTHYALRAGGNYTSFGAIDTRTHHSILISKTGAGADPIVSEFRPDGRNVIDAPEASWQLARNCRTLDIDVGTFAEGGVQFQYCGVIRGRCRTYGVGLKEFYYDNDAPNNNTRSSVRRSRGVFLWDCGELNRGGSNHGIIGGANHRHLIGVDVFVAPTGLSISALRMYDNESTIRHTRIANNGWDSGFQTWLVMIGYGDIQTYPGYSPQPWTDQVGQTGTNAPILVTPRKFIAQDFELGRAGQPWPNGPGSIGGPVNESWVSELMGWEDGVCRLAEPTGYPITSLITMTGRNHFRRNVKYNMGAGGDISVSASDGPDASFNGPRLIESTNSRPVPTAFA